MMKRRESFKLLGMAVAVGTLALSGCGGSSDVTPMQVASANAIQTITVATASQTASLISAMAGTTGLSFTMPATQIAADTAVDAAGNPIAGAGASLPANATVTVTKTTSALAGAIGDFSFVDASGATVSGVLIAGSLKYKILKITLPTGVVTSIFQLGSEITFNNAYLTLPTNNQPVNTSNKVQPILTINNNSITSTTIVTVNTNSSGVVTVNGTPTQTTTTVATLSGA